MCVCWFVCCNERRPTGTTPCIATATMLEPQHFLRTYFSPHILTQSRKSSPKSRRVIMLPDQPPKLGRTTFVPQHIVTSNFELWISSPCGGCNVHGLICRTAKKFHIFINSGFPFVCLSIDIWAKPDGHR